MGEVVLAAEQAIEEAELEVASASRSRNCGVTRAAKAFTSP
jgi:hypothetical protein